MLYKSPPPLKKGDTIGVMAPSSRVSAEDLAISKKFLEERGYKIYLHPQCAATLHQSAGNVDQKVEAFHDLVQNPDVNAVFFATGGNRALHFLDMIDFEKVAKFPKIYMGFSDNTVLLNAITAHAGIITYHGPTFKRLPKNPQADFNLRLLSGEEKTVPLHGAKIFREGPAVTGKLIGGNLSLLRSMNESDLMDPSGAILFLEDIKEETSKIDRELCALRRSGFLNKLDAIIFGQFTDLQDTGVHPFGFSFEDIIAEHTKGLNIPILTNAPFGHDVDLVALPIGKTVRLEGTALLF